MLTSRIGDQVKVLKRPSHQLWCPHLSFRPDIVVYNSDTSSVALLELACPLDSEHHILSARSRKQSKPDYLQLLAEFDCLQIFNYYETVEISVQGHYQLSSIQSIKKFTDFILWHAICCKNYSLHWAIAILKPTRFFAESTRFFAQQSWFFH